MAFIYKITNNINGKIYIGKTVHAVKRRFLEHIYESHTDTKNRPFHLAIVKYGIENFSIDIIEEVDISNVDTREQYWIQHYRSYIGFPDCNGYNATLGGDGTIKEDYQKIVNDYLITGSKDQTARNCNCCVETVRNACNALHIKTKSNCQGRKIQRISFNGDIIEYDSIRQAAIELSPTIGTCVDTIRKRLTKLVNHTPNQNAYGFHWRLL